MMHDQRQIMIIADHASSAMVPLARNDDRIVTHRICDGTAALNDKAPPHLAIVDLIGCGDEALDLLDVIDAMAEARRVRAIVIFTPECIDAVAARVASPEVTLLCEASAAERMAAIGFAVEDRHGPARSDGDLSPGLQSLAEEVARIARALASLAGQAPSAASDVFSDGLIGYRAEPAPSGGPGGLRDTAVGASEVRAMIRARRLRERFLPPDLFGEPAWDMLLDLFAARIERVKVAVSSLCIAGAVPPTTALRTIRLMTEQGLFARIADPADKRRVFIELTDQTASAMQSYIAATRAV